MCEHSQSETESDLFQDCLLDLMNTGQRPVPLLHDRTIHQSVRQLTWHSTRKARSVRRVCDVWNISLFPCSPCSCPWCGFTHEQSRDFTQDRKSAWCPLLPNPSPMGFSYYLLAPAYTAGMWFILRSLATFLSLVTQGKVCWPGRTAALTFHWAQCQQNKNAPVSDTVTPFQAGKWATR